MTSCQTLREHAAEFAGFIKSLGFKVFIAESGEYGFITDETDSRVMTWSMRDGKLSGTYGPPSRESGTGWQLSVETHHLKTADDVRRALYEMPAPFCGHGWKYLSTVKQYLALYGASSKFVEA